MDEERPSATAEGAAVMRVLHQKLDSEPKILDDPISARLIDPHSEAYSSRVELLERLPAPTSLRLRATFVMRSRYAEDCLAEAHRDGVRQYRTARSRTRHFRIPAAILGLFASDL
jgi:O-methyltransferase involved in polyketide biosynthesis